MGGDVGRPKIKKRKNDEIVENEVHILCACGQNLQNTAAPVTIKLWGGGFNICGLVHFTSQTITSSSPKSPIALAFSAQGFHTTVEFNAGLYELYERVTASIL